MLTLQEELMLLALDDDAGRIVEKAQGSLKLGLVSAVLTELTLAGKLNLDEAGRVSAATVAPTGDALMDKVLKRVAQVAPPRIAPVWLRSLTKNLPDVEAHMLQTLAQQGAVQQREARKLIFMKVTTFPQNNPDFEQNTRRHLRDVVINNAQLDAHTVALIGLIKVCNLVETAFPQAEWNPARTRIDQLTSPQFAGWPYRSTSLGGYTYTPPEHQPAAASDSQNNFVPALVYSMLAQSMFWGMSGWGMPGMDETLAKMADEDRLIDAGDTMGDMDGGFEVGGDFGGAL